MAATWFQWHTRTWVDDGALHSSVRVGFGWYLLLALCFATVLLVAWLADRRPTDWQKGLRTDGAHERPDDHD